MAHGSPTEVKDKWLARLQQSQAEMQAGVARVQTAPGAAAAAKKQKWVNALADPKTQDKWANNVRSVSLGQWQQAMNDYGIARVAQGAQAKSAKFEAAMNSLLPFIDNAVNQIRGMDDTTYAAREQRMLAFSRIMQGYRRPSS